MNPWAVHQPTRRIKCRGMDTSGPFQSSEKKIFQDFPPSLQGEHCSSGSGLRPSPPIAAEHKGAPKIGRIARLLLSLIDRLRPPQPSLGGVVAPEHRQLRLA